MSLVASCKSCGKKFRVGEEKAGKKLKCSCGTVISVPSLASVADPWDDNEEAPVSTSRSTAPPPVAGRRSRARPSGKKKGSSSGTSLGLILAIVGGGVALLAMVGGGVWFFLLREKPNAKVAQTNTANTTVTTPDTTTPISTAAPVSRRNRDPGPASEVNDTNSPEKGNGPSGRAAVSPPTLVANPPATTPGGEVPQLDVNDLITVDNAPIQKYRDQVVQITGMVHSLNISRTHINGPYEHITAEAFQLGTAKGGSFPAVCYLKDQNAPWEKYTPGQTVTIRGRVSNRANYLTDCDVLKVEGQPAPRFTATEMAKELKQDYPAVRKKLEHTYQRAFLLTGKVTKIENIGPRSRMLTLETGSKISCDGVISIYEDPEVDFPLKLGDTVTILASASLAPDSITFHAGRLCTVTSGGKPVPRPKKVDPADMPVAKGADGIPQLKAEQLIGRDNKTLEKFKGQQVEISASIDDMRIVRFDDVVGEAMFVCLDRMRSIGVACLLKDQSPPWKKYSIGQKVILRGTVSQTAKSLQNCEVLKAEGPRTPSFTVKELMTAARKDVHEFFDKLKKETNGSMAAMITGKVTEINPPRDGVYTAQVKLEAPADFDATTSFHVYPIKGYEALRTIKAGDTITFIGSIAMNVGFLQTQAVRVVKVNDKEVP